MKIDFFLSLVLPILSLATFSCSSGDTSLGDCSEQDVVCRSKYYVQLIKDRKFQELKHDASLSIVNSPSKDTMLIRASNFLLQNDSIKLSYKRVGTSRSDYIEVHINVENVSFKEDKAIGDFIIFNFAQKAVLGIPLLNWEISIIPVGISRENSDREIEELLKKMEEEKQTK